jgi:transcriptional regulator with XRE-family HTH domain
MNRKKINEAIGDEIRFARLRKRMTQEQLAQKTGLGRSTIAKYESGQIEMSMPVFIELCNAIGVSYIDILNGIDL